MELIKDLGTMRNEETGKLNRFGIFKCEVCNSVVKKHYSSGIKALGCSRSCARQDNPLKGKPSGRKGIKLGSKYETSSTCKLYKVWTTMKQRCSNPNSAKYIRYGARGIVVCEEWQDYANFEQWAMHNGYEEGLSIDRVNVDGNYEAGNCEWVSPSVNSRKDNYQIRKVAKYSMSGEFLQEYNAIIDAGKDLGVTDISVISKVCRGSRVSAYGFKWKYVE